MTLFAVRDFSRRSGCGVQPDIKSLRLLMTLLVIRTATVGRTSCPMGIAQHLPLSVANGVESGF